MSWTEYLSEQFQIGITFLDRDSTIEHLAKSKIAYIDQFKAFTVTWDNHSLFVHTSYARSHTPDHR